MSTDLTLFNHLGHFHWFWNKAIITFDGSLEQSSNIWFLFIHSCWCLELWVELYSWHCLYKALFILTLFVEDTIYKALFTLFILFVVTLFSIYADVSSTTMLNNVIKWNEVDFKVWEAKRLYGSEKYIMMVPNWLFPRVATCNGVLDMLYFEIRSRIK